MVDPVQSIRVAGNLAERFGELVGRAQVFDRGIADLELRIGEAQQIYPEIWRHLEDARNALAGRGIDVAAFDKLRGKELVQLGVTDVDAQTEIDYLGLMVGRLRYHTVKTATFNTEGYVRALGACKALMAAMPEVDWKALAAAEEQQIRAAGSLHTGVYLGIAKWLAIAAVLVGAGVGLYKLFTHGGDPEETRARRHAEVEAAEQAALRQQVDDRHRRIAEAKRAYETSCAAADRAALAAALRENSQEPDAKRVETAACRPRPPACAEGRDAAKARMARQFDLADPTGDETDDWVWRCAGGFFASGDQQPGLAVSLTAKTKAGQKIAIRGVVTRDGKADIAALETWTHQIGSIDVGDLDGDGAADVVMVHPNGIGVARVVGGKLVDVAALPVQAEDPIAHACTGSVEIEPDPEKAADRLLVNVDDGAEGKGCPRPGMHAFVLAGDKLVDAAPPE